MAVFPLRRSRREVGAAGENPPVCLSAVSYAAAIPNEFSMAYASAALHGRAEVVTDEAEQVKAMLLLCTAYDPRAWAGSASIWKNICRPPVW